MNNEFEKIRTDIQFGNDEVIDSCLRAYMQEKHTAISFAIKDAEALPQNNSTRKQISKLYKTKNFLDNLVFNDDDWSAFSQKIKSGNFYN